MHSEAALKATLDSMKRDAATLQETQKGIEARINKTHQEIYAEEQRIQDFLSATNIDNLVAVHITDYFPKGGVIHPRSHWYTFKLVKRLWHNKIAHEMEFRVPRYTLHFTLNYTVPDHNMGSWSNKRFAILIPLKDMQKRLLNINPVDSWVLGDFTLPKSAEILMRKTMYLSMSKDKILQDKVKGYWEKRAGDAQIITYDDNTPICDAVHARIQEKGYPLIAAGHHDWDLLCAFRRVNTLKKSIGQKTDTYDDLLYRANRGYERFLDLFKKLVKETGTSMYEVHAYTIFYDIEAYTGTIEDFTHHRNKDPNVVKERGEKLLAQLREERERLLSTPIGKDEKTLEAFEKLEDDLKKMISFVAQFQKTKWRV